VLAAFKGHRDTVSSVESHLMVDFLLLLPGTTQFASAVCAMGRQKKLPMMPHRSIPLRLVLMDDVFSGNSGGFLMIWDTRTGTLVGKWKEGPVFCVTLSKDGKGLVSGVVDMMVKYWDVTFVRRQIEFSKNGQHERKRRKSCKLRHSN
jgi:hypothetical protein